MNKICIQLFSVDLRYAQPFDNVLNDFSEEGGCFENVQSGKGLRVDWEAVGHNHFFKSSLLDGFDGITRENAVRRGSVDIAVCTSIYERFLGVAETPGGIDHIIEDDAGTPFNVTHDFHNFCLLMLRAALMHDG